MTHHPPRSPLFPYTTLFRSTGRPEDQDAPAVLNGGGTGHIRTDVVALDQVVVRGQENTGKGVARQQIAIERCQPADDVVRSEEHTSELQSQSNLVCRLLLEK